MVFRQEMAEYVVPVFGRKVRRVQGYAKLVADLLCVFKVGDSCAVIGAIVFVPVFHEQPFNGEALLQQQIGSNVMSRRRRTCRR